MKVHCLEVMRSSSSGAQRWVKGNLVTTRYSYDLKPNKRVASYLQYVVPTPYNSMEAYLLLEAARSDRQISCMQMDLAVKIIHRNTIALQFNGLMLKRAQKDLHAADELVGYTHLSIRQSGHSAASEYVLQECNLPRCSNFHPFTPENTHWHCHVQPCVPPNLPLLM